MTILTRYIAGAYLKILGLCLASFVAIYLVIDFLEKIGRLLRFHPRWIDIVQYFICKLPEIITQVIPLAVLMSTLLTLGMLSRNSEIVAMRGCGIGLGRISAPLIVIAAAVSLLTIFSNEFVLPSSYRQMRYVDQVLIRKQGTNTFFRQNNIWHKDESAIMMARVFDPGRQALRGITLWRFSDGMRPVSRIDAAEGTWDGARWTFKTVTVRGLAGPSVETRTLASLPAELNLKIEDLKVVDKYADNMGFFKLRDYVRKLKAGGYDTTRYEAQMHSKISLPFASLIMAFLGIPFALRGGRSSGVALGITASIGIGFAYFITNSILISFGQTGILPPLISAWAANVLFALSGIWLAMTLDR
ncbi:LPS export ABC transporter permease LptG [Geobacter sulfurreducens]|uniref:LPS export ABC transporter permease LptG n=1 Tax=Geobacter sulfurreducens TaxID=35554 RepID=UPI002C6B185A|nr:LPS export ABC transporter permease LptG [Geobacter sulfurreducens]HML78051.1 LPS export ABC transporter permease LptG [Geobacter sulfurreducens]